MKLAASDILSIPLERVTTRMRKRQRGEQSQYGRQSEASKRIVVMEGGSRFIVDLSAYLDTGLFLDHRPARLMVRERARGKSVLNLFCYTGAFSVHAACAGATKVTSVDLSKTYLAWAQDNFRENGLNAPYAVQDAAQGASQSAAQSASQSAAYAFVHMDVRIFLNNALKANERWDIIILDPPPSPTQNARARYSTSTGTGRPCAEAPSRSLRREEHSSSRPTPARSSLTQAPSAGPARARAL
jgi:23S rRNA G2069 N7-methylase RlmK/C1962 C5-methylase RlmI